MEESLYQSAAFERRTLLKQFAAAAAVAAMSGGIAVRRVHGAVAPPTFSAAGILQHVNPLIGTGWHGHTFPGATAPFGLVQLSPDTAGPPEPRWNGNWDVYNWDHCSGYHYPDDTILGFSHTHLQGPGAADLGDLLLMPVVQGANWAWEAHYPGKQHAIQAAALGGDSGWVAGMPGYASHFSHSTEVAQAGYYGVNLDAPRVKAELTATTRCGMHRYTFNTQEENPAGVLLDLAHGLRESVYHAELQIESPTRLSGIRSTHGWVANKQVYFVIEFSRPIAGLQTNVDGNIAQHPAAALKLLGTKVKVILQWPNEVLRSRPLVIRVGISCTGIKGARKNLRAEIPHWNFDAVRRQTAAAWSNALSVLDADLPTKPLTDVFYTGAYHGLVAPATFNDVDGAYRGQDHHNHPNPGFTKYTALSIWDIYRGEFPFIMLMQPHRVGGIIKTLLDDYDKLKQHSLPVWPLWGNETWCMTGFHVVAMIAGAYARGFRDFDAEKLYAAMRDTALMGATANGNKQLQQQFRTLGYVASAPGAQSVSRTLDFAYDYWCVGAMAQLLGKHDDAAMFYKLAQNYRNLFDSKTGFMRGKSAQGQWREPFRPDQEYWHDYTESDAWQATFNVMQDVQGLIDMYGGDKQFIAKLDAFFTAPSKIYKSPPDISGMVGQDAQGNEPSNHIPYLYTFAGAAWKTQYWVRRVLRLYNATPTGIPGNDDCGQISTCFTMGAMGFYPVNAATGVYVLGSPLVKRVTIHNPHTGKPFTIIAADNSDANMYIQSAELNGKELTRSWITHGEIVAGGELLFRMGNRPNKEWASAKADRPPSGLVV
ncbi:MAG: glycoside hydrolase family 92 protein [Phycisphaerales bacterium]|nr:glycoside hydrolase family 92 protein [Phycisphaerales bacterium]